jgi:hypothetical protein
VRLGQSSELTNHLDSNKGSFRGMAHSSQEL